MGKEEYALAWAARGFKVFPLRENAKEPAISSFGSQATTDPAIIRAWWRDPVTGIERDYNIGVLCNDMVVADIDGKDGRPGMDTYHAHGGHFDTLVVRTPTGGYHAYFNGPDSSLAPIGPGLDIRSHNGYVIAPGSTINGGAYELAVDADLAWGPYGIESQLRPPGRRAERDDELVDLDTPTALANAQAWLQTTAPLAVEGQNGDDTTYRVAAMLVRDYALSPETAFYMLAEHWNERCAPPWHLDELWRKVENAGQYGNAALGSARPEVDFGSVTIIDPIPERLQTINGFGNAMLMSEIAPRPWVMRGLLMRRELSILAAAGASGKSVIGLTIAAHLAVGRDFGRFKCTGPTRSFVYNAEDGLDEQSRRLYAICQEYQFPYDHVKEQLLLISGNEAELTLCNTVNRQPVSNETHVQWLLQNLSDPGIGLCVLDPLIDLHNCDESNNAEMRVLMSIIRRVAVQSNVAMLLPHHTSKPGAGGGHGRAGNVDVSRGASAITNKARITMTMFPATDQDREVYGISEDDRHKFVRMDDAKMNLTIASSQSVWFRKQPVRLINGDDVGAFMLHDMTTTADTQNRVIAQHILNHMRVEETAHLSLKRAVAVMQEADPLYNRMSDVRCRNVIEKALRRPIELEDGTVKLDRSTNKEGKDTAVIVLV